MARDHSLFDGQTWEGKGGVTGAFSSSLLLSSLELGAGGGGHSADGHEAGHEASHHVREAGGAGGGEGAGGEGKLGDWGRGGQSTQPPNPNP